MPLARLLRSLAGRPAPAARTRPPVARLGVESLEDRSVPSAGALDPTFGGTGLILTAVGSGGSGGGALALQTDGKVIAAGGAYTGTRTQNDFALLRYLADGT